METLIRGTGRSLSVRYGVLGWIVLGIVAAACGGGGGESGPASSGIVHTEPPSIPRLNEDEVKAIVVDYIAAGGGKIRSTRVPYYEDMSSSVPCSEYDAPARCFFSGGSAEYGYKTERTRERRCCKSELVRVPGYPPPSWEIVYDGGTDDWQVSIEFDYEGEEQSAAWEVADNTKQVDALPRG